MKHCIQRSGQKELKQAFLNDKDIDSKLDFSKPVNFLIHGWLSGLYDGNMHMEELNIRTPSDSGMYLLD